MNETAHCSTCGAEWEQPQCANCGGSTRTVSIGINVTVSSTEEVIGHKPPSASGEEVFSAGSTRETRAHADSAPGSGQTVDPAGVAPQVSQAEEAIRTINSSSESKGTAGKTETSLSMPRGSTPKNEEGSLAVAHIYGERLAIDGGKRWPTPFREVPTAEDPTIDVVAETKADSGKVRESLRMQVVRPLSSDAWRALSRKAEVGASASEIALSVMEAIRIKLKRYPTAADRSSLVLLIDATTAVNAVLQVVVDAFREAHASEALSAGFQEIWLVGPTQGLTRQLV
jgi:hypothetical protein